MACIYIYIRAPGKLPLYFRGFFTGSDPVKNALFTGFDILYPVKNTVKFHRFFTGSFTEFFTG